MLEAQPCVQPTPALGRFTEQQTGMPEDHPAQNSETNQNCGDHSHATSKEEREKYLTFPDIGCSHSPREFLRKVFKVIFMDDHGESGPKRLSRDPAAMPGLSDTTMGRTSCCVPSSACHQDQDSAILGMSPTSGPRCPQRVTNTGTAPLGEKKELHLRAGTAGFVPALVLWGNILAQDG
ncbi:uncharacterized protein [Patagioenas fasciata]|uniref:uncharacterized protein isoform X4 n=1 Tax=Patagioenas fasciata TaxID=372321 RepID=UPI003A992F39